MLYNSDLPSDLPALTTLEAPVDDAADAAIELDEVERAGDVSVPEARGGAEAPPLS